MKERDFQAFDQQQPALPENQNLQLSIISRYEFPTLGMHENSENKLSQLWERTKFLKQLFPTLGTHENSENKLSQLWERANFSKTVVPKVGNSVFLISLCKTECISKT